MAIKDPKARRAVFHYPKGHVTGALGLLDVLFGADRVSSGFTVKLDKRGRRRLTGLLNRTQAVGGKQLDIVMKDGHTYQLHYGGTLTDWALNGAIHLNTSVVLGWSTVRGKLRYV